MNIYKGLWYIAFYKVLFKFLVIFKVIFGVPGWLSWFGVQLWLRA